jgi:hypothetical protein
MKEERGLLQDVIGTAPPERENKGKKYFRFAMIAIFACFFLILIIAAVVRRYGA